MRTKEGRREGGRVRERWMKVSEWRREVERDRERVSEGGTKEGGRESEEGGRESE